MAKPGNKSLMSVVAALYNSKEFSDFTITCNGEEIPAHMNVVFPQSKPLAAFMRFPGTESNTRVIDLPDDDPEAVCSMIKYFYTGDDFYDGRYYSFAPKDKVPDSIPKYAKPYIVAEKYDVPGLKDLICHRAQADLRGLQRNTASATVLLQTLKLLYEETPESDQRLKNILLEVLVHPGYEFWESDEFKSLNEKNSELFTHVIQLFGRKYAELYSFRAKHEPCSSESYRNPVRAPHKIRF